ncbi:MAG: EF-hand domain-containing protein [Paracoccaceae bacterium]
MKRFAMVLAPLAMAGAAYAADLPMVEDADASGNWSLAELQTVWADLTEDGYTAIDANADGAVDAAELQTAWDNGVLKPVEG